MKQHIHFSKGMENVQLIIYIYVVALSTLHNITASCHFNYNYINIYYIDINLFLVLMKNIAVVNPF